MACHWHICQVGLLGWVSRFLVDVSSAAAEILDSGREQGSQSAPATGCSTLAGEPSGAAVAGAGAGTCAGAGAGACAGAGAGAGACAGAGAGAGAPVSPGTGAGTAGALVAEAVAPGFGELSAELAAHPASSMAAPQASAATLRAVFLVNISKFLTAKGFPHRLAVLATASAARASGIGRTTSLLRHPSAPAEPMCQTRNCSLHEPRTSGREGLQVIDGDELACRAGRSDRLTQRLEPTPVTRRFGERIVEIVPVRGQYVARAAGHL